MTTDFDSFDESPFGGFMESPLGEARGISGPTPPVPGTDTLIVDYWLGGEANEGHFSGSLPSFYATRGYRTTFALWNPPPTSIRPHVDTLNLHQYVLVHVFAMHGANPTWLLPFADRSWRGRIVFHRYGFNRIPTSIEEAGRQYIAQRTGMVLPVFGEAPGVFIGPTNSHPLTAGQGEMYTWTLASVSGGTSLFDYDGRHILAHNQVTDRQSAVVIAGEFFEPPLVPPPHPDISPFLLNLRTVSVGGP